MQSISDQSIEKFAKAVRAELADLSQTEVEELTEGLESDLAERLAEEGSAFELGSASDYAAELRASAGLGASKRRKRSEPWASTTARLVGWFNSGALRKSLYEFALPLRPIWWLIRVVILWVILTPVSFDFAWWLFPAAVLASVMWGQKKWFTSRFFATILLPLNVLALLMIFPAQDIITRSINGIMADRNALSALQNQPIEGFRLNGELVAEIVAIDSDGNKVEGLKFQDSKGNPIELASETNAVPNVSGLSLVEATRILTVAGIENVEINYAGEAEDPLGVVLDTRPAAGQPLEQGEAVLLVIGRY